MADFVHITSMRAARRIERTGIAARSHGAAEGRGVYCMPVLASFTLTHLWVRELRRWHSGVLVAVNLQLPDDEPVTVGRFGQPKREVTAAQSVAAVREVPDPCGYEVFVPARSPPPRYGGSATFHKESDGGTSQAPTADSPAHAQPACSGAHTRWPGFAGGFPTTSRPAPRVN